MKAGDAGPCILAWCGAGLGEATRDVGWDVGWEAGSPRPASGGGRGVGPEAGRTLRPDPGPRQRGPARGEGLAGPVNINIHLGSRQKHSSPRNLWASVRISSLPRGISRKVGCCWEGAGCASLRPMPSVLVGSASQRPAAGARPGWLFPLDGVPGAGRANRTCFPETGPGGGRLQQPCLPRGTSPFCASALPRTARHPPPQGGWQGSLREGKRLVREHPASERPAWACPPRPPEAQPHARLWNCPAHGDIPEAWVRPLARGFSGQLLAWRGAGGAQRRAPSPPGVTERGS